MKPVRVLFILSAILLVLVGFFLFWGLSASNWQFFLPRRAIKLAAIALTGAAISYATISFQTISGNRILTPGVIGLDSLYLFIQTTVVFLSGAGQLTMLSREADYLVSIGAMIIFSLLLFRILFHGENRRLFTVILMGMVMGSLFSSLATFMQVLIDPNEFLVVQNRMFASFNQVNSSLLLMSTIILAVTAIFGVMQLGRLDVLTLGRDNAINLGINYNATVRVNLVIISVMIAVSTALVGPVTFLGLMTANLARQMLRTFRHGWLVSITILVSLIALIGGQFLVERVFRFSTPVSVIINFAGGIYFLYLLLKEAKPK